MIIVHCVLEMEIGGSQVLVVDLLNAMSTSNNMHLIILNDCASENLLKQLQPNIKVYNLKRTPRSYNPIPILKLNRLLLKLRPDIVHCHEGQMVRAIKLRNFALVLSIHDVNISLAYYSKYDVLVAVSNAVYADVKSRCSFPLVKINNGVPGSNFQKRVSYSLKAGEQLKLVQVSRLVHQKKGQDILMRALHRLVYEKNVTDISVDFAGSGESLDYLQALSSELRLNKHVTFLGEKGRNWLFDNLCQYHALIQPSRWEGFGLTIVEGINAGLPVLASNIDGPAQILAGVPQAFLFENGNVDLCVNQLIRIRGLYQCNEMEKLVRQHSMKPYHYYSMSDCANAYLEVYNTTRTGKSTNRQGPSKPSSEKHLA